MTNRKFSGPAFVGAILISCSAAALVSAPAPAAQPEGSPDPDAIEVAIAGDDRGAAEDPGHSGEIGPGGALFVGAETMRRIQLALNESGFDAGDADGIFGPRTKAAVCSFQSRTGLEPTGGITLATLQRLGVAVDPADGSAGDPLAGSGVDAVPVMVSRASIRQVQDAMVRAGQGWVGVDGMWTSSTSQALRRWQEAQGLEATGTITLETLAAIGGTGVASAGAVLAGGSDTPAADLADAEDGAAAAGAGEGAAVEATAEADGTTPAGSREAGPAAVSPEAADESGVTTMTEESGDGASEPSHLSCEDAAAHADPYATQLHVGPATVRRIEQVLSEAEYEAGDVDGIFDSGLSYGLVRYQTELGLEPTGTLTVRTVSELGLGEVLQGAGS